MKHHLARLLYLSSLLVLLSGCVSIPPLIQVEHKETNSNADVMRRLDAIDRRLDQIEQSQKK